MKGIILAAGKGSRLGAITAGIGPAGVGLSKPGAPVFDKPSIYYPLADMISAGIKEVMVIAAPDNVEWFRALLGDGSSLGIIIEYGVQEVPLGIAEAFIIAEDFIGDGDVALMFGDNVFNGSRFVEAMKASTSPRGATVFAYYVENPSAFGVVEFNKRGRAISLEEKPEHPKSQYAVPGAYFYTCSVVEVAKGIQPSARGELEITDVNRVYLEKNLLDVTVLESDTEWFDTGTPESLDDASTHVRRWQQRHKRLLGSPEAAAYLAGNISAEQLIEHGNRQGKAMYGQKLIELATVGWPN